MRKLRYSLSCIIALLSFFVLFSPPAFSLESSLIDRSRVLDEYFPPWLIEKLHKDAAPIIKKFAGVNVFSSAQYGDCFLTGEIDAGDIFDARKPENLKIFKQYARDNLLIRNVPHHEHYHKYAPAAVKFMEEFGFDLILFYPDEYHTVFTRSNDTWLFVREGKHVKSGDEYVTARLKNPAIAIEGGLPMEPLQTIGFVQYYIPMAGSSYTPYRAVEKKLPAYKLHETAGIKPTQENLNKRKQLGISPSPLSGRKNLKIGTWMSKDDCVVKFKATGQRYTWGDHGFYAVPLEPSFWDELIK